MSQQIPEFYPPPDKRIRPDIPLVRATVQAKKWTGVLPDKFIASLVTRVSQTNLQTWINDLSAFHTRHTKSTYITQVITWLVDKFKDFGYADVIKQSYVKDSYQLDNVVCTKQGTGNTGKVIIVCGHFDCIMENSQDATARAPGADDNATGMAVILEVARILADVQLEDTVQFVGFSGEEQGLWGSTAYAQHIQSGNINVHRLINLDMVGHSPANSSIIVERDTGNQTTANDSDSHALGNLMAQMAADYTTTPVEFGQIYASDYMPFEARGYVVAGLYEGEGNPNYHHGSDTPGTVNYPYVADAARITLATLLSETASVVSEISSPVDVYIRDSDIDTGEQPSGFPHWQSPDIWVRNNPPPADPNDPNDPNYEENPDDGHQPPINDVPNYLYVRVRNRGSQQAAGLFVKAYRCDPGTGMIWPDHFDLIGNLPVAASVPPNNNGSVRVGPFIWTPQIVDHECLLAIVSGPGDHAIPDIYSGQLEHGLLVRFDNNVGQRNVKPAPSTPGGKTKMSFVVWGTTHPSLNTLHIDTSPLPLDTKIAVRVARTMTDQADSLTGFVLKNQNTKWSTLALSGGAVGAVVGFPLASTEPKHVTIEIDFSYQAEHLKRYPIIVSQEQDGVAAGRLTIEITAVKESEDYVYGNIRSREVHTLDCVFRKAMSPRNQVPFQNIKDALARGYNGCAFCLPAYNSDRKREE
jgi:hypothetical protein